MTSNSWFPLLDPPIQNTASGLYARAEIERQTGKIIYPPQEDIFRALELTQPQDLRCVILGQDPYHGKGQAHGLSFSVRPGVPLPKSLQNIFKELSSDIGCGIPNHGCLESWAKNGVLLLNTILTVYEGSPGSHKDWGWQTVTQGILEQTRSLPFPIAFILWGSKAKEAADCAQVTTSPYPRLCISSAHPSPLAAYRGFFGSKPFSQVNTFLFANGSKPIDWELPSQ